MAGIESGPSIGAIQSSQQAHGAGGGEPGTIKTGAFSPLANGEVKPFSGSLGGLGAALGDPSKLKGLGEAGSGFLGTGGIFASKEEAWKHTMGANSPYPSVADAAHGMASSGVTGGHDVSVQQMGHLHPDTTPNTVAPIGQGMGV